VAAGGRGRPIPLVPIASRACPTCASMMPISGKPEIGRGDPGFAKARPNSLFELDSRFRGNERSLLSFRRTQSTDLTQQ
jgi:hypothetical protein